MKIEQARMLSAVLLKAANRAEAAGRDTLTEEDLDAFAQFDDIARADLVRAIESASATGDN